MWWKTIFCGLIATIVTSPKVFGEHESLIDFYKPLGEYKRLFWLEYPDCLNSHGKPEDFLISAPSETFINTCKGQKKKYKSCFCKLAPEIKTIIYDIKTCNHYEEYPDEMCKAFTICGNGKKYLMMCKFNTVYNPLRKSCDHPANFKCHRKLKNLPKESTKLNVHSKSLRPLCPDFMVELGKFPDVNSGCHSYFECLLGVMERKDCPEGLIFDTYTHDCNFPKYSICGCSFNKTSTFDILN